eukprot:gene12111-12250_t
MESSRSSCSSVSAQDVAYATLLSELVYRAAECRDSKSFTQARQAVEAHLDTRFQDLQHHRSGGQRYLVGESEDAIYVAFQGTKHFTDWFANLNFYHGPSDHRGASNFRLVAAARGSSVNPDPMVRCISFATPAVANEHLLQEVSAAGWDDYIVNIVIPEDPVVQVVNKLMKSPTMPIRRSSLHSRYRLPLASITTSCSCSSLASSSSDGCSSSSEESLAALQYEPLLLPDLPQHNHSVVEPAQHSASMGGSAELHSWLTAAQSALQQRRHTWPGKPWLRSRSQVSLTDSSRQGSLVSLQSAGEESCGPFLSGWSICRATAGGELVMSPGRRLGASFVAASAAAVGWLSGGSFGDSAASCQSQDSITSSSFQFPPGSLTESNVTAAAGAEYGSAAAAAANGGHGFVGIELSSEVSKSLGKVKLAWLAGALAAGVRCAAAFAAPHLFAPHAVPLLSLPHLMIAPIGLATLHLVGSFQAALPVSHPLGQQWVLTANGSEEAAKPLSSYPKHADALKLKELGGLFPGHRMIAYRRRVVALRDQGLLC